MKSLVVVISFANAPQNFLHNNNNNNNKVTGYIHWTFFKQMGLQVADRCYEHIPRRVINVNGTTIMWGVPVTTDRTVLANRPGVQHYIMKKRRLAF
jgi:hypothetical protein